MRDLHFQVFPLWINTFKVLGCVFEDTDIPFVLYDGSMTRAECDAILRSFSTNPTIKSILFSTIGGAQGLGLTVDFHQSSSNLHVI